jgi:quinol-cytochrome oxidoreductase complex cytochrome b subunit
MSDRKHPDGESAIPFYPDHVRTELRVVIAILIVAGIVGLVAIFAPVGLHDPADPMNTPEHVKPEWYFLGLYQLLKFIPKTTGAVLPVLAVLLVLLWPFLDRRADPSPRAVQRRLAFVAVAVVVLVAMTLWGGVS